MKRTLYSALLLVAGLLAAGCTHDTHPRPKGRDQLVRGTADVDKTKYLLAAEPASAQGVMAVREHAQDGDAVVVVGRIGGDKRPFTGQAAFFIIDCQAKPCDENEGPEMMPWEYCCEPDRPKKMVLVKFTDQNGQTLPFDAEYGLGLAPLNTVVVQGTMVRKDGVLAIVASGVHVKSK